MWRGCPDGESTGVSGIGSLRALSLLIGEFYFLRYVRTSLAQTESQARLSPALSLTFLLSAVVGRNQLVALHINIDCYAVQVARFVAFV